MYSDNIILYVCIARTGRGECCNVSSDQSKRRRALKIRDNICISVAFFTSTFSHAINTSFTGGLDRCERGLAAGVYGV